MEITYKKSVGEVVALDYRTASIFEKYGIDFCCKGHKSIEDVCESKRIMTEDVMRDLKKLLFTHSFPDSNYLSWPLSRLVDDIETKHHRYVEEKTPVIQRYLDKLCSVHGANHPELFEIRRLFNLSAEELAQHMKKEELILFPRIRKMEFPDTDASSDQHVISEMIRQPIDIMMKEHNTEGDRFKTIDALTNHYQPPADACNTHKVTFALLQEFETNLHFHIHLENNILFPRSIEMANELMN